MRWQLQGGVITVPKSRELERIRSNADVAGFELSVDDMAALEGWEADGVTAGSGRVRSAT